MARKSATRGLTTAYSQKVETVGQLLEAIDYVAGQMRVSRNDIPFNGAVRAERGEDGVVLLTILRRN